MDSFLNNAPFLFFSSEDDGTIVEVNETFCRQVGYTAAELVGQKASIFFTVATNIFQQTHLFPLLKMQGQAAEIYISLKTKEKENLPLLVNVDRRKMDDRYVLLYAGITVHNRKKFEDELVAAKKVAEAALNENTALLQAKRDLQRHAELLDEQMFLSGKQNEELRQFSRIVTHDLQEPLRKLFVFTNMLQESREPEFVNKTVLKIRSVSEQMHALVSGLQQYIWLIETPVNRTQIRLEDLLANTCNQIRKETPGVEIELETENLPVFFGDNEQMAFLFREIVCNSVRFRKEAGPVVLRASGVELKKNRFMTDAGKYEYVPFLKMEIKDNGVGFDNIYRKQVFELFRRLHATSKRGIGLSLCKKIVENHGGSISVDSIPGEGTTINILLPVFTPSTVLEEANPERYINPTLPNGS